MAASAIWNASLWLPLEHLLFSERRKTPWMKYNAYPFVLQSWRNSFVGNVAGNFFSKVRKKNCGGSLTDVHANRCNLVLHHLLECFAERWSEEQLCPTWLQKHLLDDGSCWRNNAHPGNLDWALRRKLIDTGSEHVRCCRAHDCWNGSSTGSSHAEENLGFFFANEYYCFVNYRWEFPHV